MTRKRLREITYNVTDGWLCGTKENYTMAMPFIVPIWTILSEKGFVYTYIRIAGVNEDFLGDHARGFSYNNLVSGL